MSSRRLRSLVAGWFTRNGELRNALSSFGLSPVESVTAAVRRLWPWLEPSMSARIVERVRTG